MNNRTFRCFRDLFEMVYNILKAIGAGLALVVAVAFIIGSTCAVLFSWFAGLFWAGAKAKYKEELAKQNTIKAA